MGHACAGWLTFALIILLWPGNSLRADSVSNSSSNSSVATLDYQEMKSGVINWSVSITTQDSAFKKEPPAVPGKIVRGVLEIGPNASNAIPFLWQRGAGKLYLGLDRDEDLTAPTAGVFKARNAEIIYYQTFTNVHLVLNTAFGRCPVSADITVWDNGGEPRCNFWVHSLWQGKLTLQG
jgi:hypothetical protein